jgi:hypothetical protein
MRDFLDGMRLRAIWEWARLRAGESSTWAGFAMIAVVLGSDPMQAHGMAQAISLVIGGGLVATGPIATQEDRR